MVAGKDFLVWLAVDRVAAWNRDRGNTRLAGLRERPKLRWPSEPRNMALGYTGPMAEAGKLLIFFGLVLVACGAGMMLLGRSHLPLGRLPGDMIYRGKNTTVYFPLATCILVSVVLTVAMYVIERLRR